MSIQSLASVIDHMEKVKFIRTGTCPNSLHKVLMGEGCHFTTRR